MGRGRGGGDGGDLGAHDGSLDLGRGGRLYEVGESPKSLPRADKRRGAGAIHKPASAGRECHRAAGALKSV